ESLTEESRTQEKLHSDSNATASSGSELPSKSVHASKSMQELLARSEQLLQEIRAASDEVLQEKLSALAEKTETETEPPELAAVDDSVVPLSDEELVQAASKNQLEARELLSKMMRSEAAKQQGNSSELQQGDNENTGGNGTGGQ